VGSWLKLLGMMLHQNPLLTQLKKCCVSSDINGTEDDSQWEEDYEEKYATSEESVGWASYC
jgi:hypothetical protein